MVKLVIQIPCLNEENTLPATLADIPREVPGVDCIEILIVDDGSDDNTLQVAESLGVDHIYRHKTNQGLGRAFRTGLQMSLKHGADIIVNTDGDGQYAGGDIPALIQPILSGNADIVIGDRQTATSTEFGVGKKILQWMGSHVVRSLSGTDIPDAVSGFRAISSHAGIKLNILSKFSYTVEMIIQAANKDLAIASVPIKTNPKTRESRLFKNIPQFMARQVVSMLRMYAMYRPMRFFFYLGTVISLVGLFPVLRFLYFYIFGDGSGNIQSLILGGVFLMMGFTVFITGLLSDLISQSRQIAEASLEKLLEMDLAQRDSDT